MHELSLALKILDVVAEQAERRGGVRVLGIWDRGQTLLCSSIGIARPL